jgi:hypothetical protein
VGWWSSAKLENFEDRNITNNKIRELTSLSELLRYASKLIYQTARGARAMVSQIARSKVLSSYPAVTELLEQADRVAIDSPLKFADMCKNAASMIAENVVDLEHERDTFTGNTLHKRLKGLQDE